MATQRKQVNNLFPSCAVTRAMAKAEKAAQDKSRRNELSNVSTVNEMVRQETSREHESTKQSGDDVEQPGLSPSKLVIEQERDPEISNLRKEPCYFVNSCTVLMRKWRPPNVPASHEWSVVYQIPPPYRRDILVLAHETPLAGHLGVEKTHRKIMGHFYWPGLHDVEKFCKTCHVSHLAKKPNQNPPVSPQL